MSEPLNEMQLKLLEVHGQGDFAHLSVYDQDKAVEIAKSPESGDLLLAFMLVELGQAATAEEAADMMESASRQIVEISVALDTLR